MKANYNYELIRDYLDGILDSTTSKEIENSLREDEIARSIANGILLLRDEFHSEEEIENYLSRRLASNKETIKKHQSTGRSYFVLKIAASVTILLLSTFVIYRFTQPDISTLVDAELSTPYQAALVLRNSDEPTGFEKAITLYNNQQYDQAEKLFASEGDIQSSFFKGLCHLYTGEFAFAIIELEKSDLSQSRYAEQGRWYLSLAYLKANRKDDARTSLKMIIDANDHYKKEEAARITALLTD